MTPALLRAQVVAERSAWIRKMISQLKGLPLESYEVFYSDPRNMAAAESYLRRCLEALLDLGRHLLAKGFGQAVSEYKEIARVLKENEILDEEGHLRMVKLAGYRNRLVHYYQEISNQELYEICTDRLGDIEGLLAILLKWIAKHPDKIEGSL
jgi:uncharacterized protein YutE (UPF0331/DUF86 family)